VAQYWSEEELEMVADARRVLGYHGAFAPYNKLKEKFSKANTLRDALALRPKKNTVKLSKQSYTRKLGSATRFNHLLGHNKF
jgi:hypothetical protein